MIVNSQYLSKLNILEINQKSKCSANAFLNFNKLYKISSDLETINFSLTIRLTNLINYAKIPVVFF